MAGSSHSMGAESGAHILLNISGPVGKTIPPGEMGTPGYFSWMP